MRNLEVKTSNSGQKSTGSNDECINEDLIATRAPKTSPKPRDNNKLIRRPTIDVNELKNRERYITVTDFVEII